MQHGSLNLSRNRSEEEWKAPHGSSFSSAKEVGVLEDEEEEPLSLKADSPTELSLASAEGNSHEIPTTSFCPNCIRLKKKIRELQAELDMLRSGKLPEPPVLPPQVPELQEFSDPTGKPCRVSAFSKPCLRKVLRCLCAVYPSKAFCSEYSGEQVFPWKVHCQVFWMNGTADVVGTVEDWEVRKRLCTTTCSICCRCNQSCTVNKEDIPLQTVCLLYFWCILFQRNPVHSVLHATRKQCLKVWINSVVNTGMCALCVWNYVLLCSSLEGTLSSPLP